MLASSRTRRIPKLSLGIIAALTPDTWDVEIVDESFEPFEYKPADLVGLTAFTQNINRAYEIARIYAEKGTTTVMGGIHASFLPDEALQYVDIMVKGETESVWRNLIADFEAGNCHRVYKGEHLELKSMPLPRYNLFSKNGRIGNVQTTRGCPMNCNFCTVTAFNGNRYRHRPVEEVVDELEKMAQKVINFADDNIIGHGFENQERALTLLKK